MPALTILWVWVCAYLSCAGWLLSVLHELNAPAYAVTLGLGLFLVLVWRQKTGIHFSNHLHLFTLRRRFSRPFPRAFLLVTGLALMGGLLYPPTNYDALSYRLPRVLNWLAEGRWHWIHSLYPRLNARGCGIEWVSAPLLALTRSDRLLFLINAVSFLLLPGLVYSTFTRLGVRRRVAWHWMWLAPTGYCLLLQAGSIGNDLYGATLALAAVDFALRAQKSLAAMDLYASILAAALMTGAKASNLPLLLPWAIALWPSWRLFLWKFGWAAPVCLMALAASFFPNAVFNTIHLHDWSGTQAESGGAQKDPALRTPANLVLMAVQNLAPPVFPVAEAWNRWVKVHIPASLSLRLHRDMVEPEAAEFALAQMQMEENAGFGFGLTLLVAASVVATLGRRSLVGIRDWCKTRETAWRAALRLAPWVALLALLSQSAIGGVARVAAPYYILILPALLLAPAQEWLVRRFWWRAAAALVYLLAGMVLVFSPARPLFPVPMITHFWPGQSAALTRATTVYNVYRQRHEAFSPALAQLPPGVTVLGLFTYDDPETSLWLPLGNRRIRHILPGDSVVYLKEEGIHYILVEPEELRRWLNDSPEDWLRGLNAQVIKKIPLALRASEGAQDWWLVQLP